MEAPLADLVNAARESLVLGVRKSKQGAYARREPEPESLPYFARARETLEDVLIRCPGNTEALVMMSQLAESLLEFDSAVTYLQKAFAAGEPRTKKSLKRVALMQENARAWRELGITPKALRDLGAHLEEKGVNPGNRNLDLTEEWLSGQGYADPEAVIGALKQRGAFSDFQVLANIVHG
jgi:hypothetical protein